MRKIKDEYVHIFHYCEPWVLQHIELNNFLKYICTLSESPNYAVKQHIIVTTLFMI
jgi:hypothetical protein